MRTRTPSSTEEWTTPRASRRGASSASLSKTRKVSGNHVYMYLCAHRCTYNICTYMYVYVQTSTYTIYMYICMYFVSLCVSGTQKSKPVRFAICLFILYLSEGHDSKHSIMNILFQLRAHDIIMANNWIVASFELTLSDVRYLTRNLGFYVSWNNSKKIKRLALLDSQETLAISVRKVELLQNFRLYCISFIFFLVRRLQRLEAAIGTRLVCFAE